MNEEIIKLNNLSKTYHHKGLKVLDNISITFETGKFYAIRGHSGSGKSTLINIIGLLDNFDNGIYEINGVDTKEIKENEEADLRKKLIGFVFQDFYLDEHLNAYENVLLPILINVSIKKEERENLVKSLLKSMNLDSRKSHFPKELSGGEKQRVAIARALANDPQIILADEPTGNLDEESEENIFKILKDLSDKGKCVIVVSHSDEIIKYADVVYKLKDGKLIKE